MCEFRGTGVHALADKTVRWVAMELIGRTLSTVRKDLEKLSPREPHTGTTST